jgi:hypothetical protein
MPVYDDYGGRNARGASALAALIAETPHLFRFAPGLREYLTGYPGARLPHAHDILYWARDETSGLQPTTTLNHRVVFTPAGPAGVTIAATKQVVANHYLEAALEVLAVIDRPESGSERVYVMFLRLYRFDQMPKKFMISLRSQVVAKLRQQARADLERLARR